MPKSPDKTPPRRSISKVRSSAVDQPSDNAFDAVVASLFTPAQLRPRRWLMNLSFMLGQVGQTRSHDLQVTAERMGVSLTFVRRLVSGLISRQGPTASTLLAYADAQDCTLEITVRTKQGKVLGSVSSADLDRERR